ncbi:MarR family winged helix-turn-helix transcriptional regulator [Enterococcus raffinosus]|uniref:MarR family transcriptional regulator n=1 Tax=Enterococcus raffinosus TaxID=71452 RepID=A0AAW8SZR8_9ENTE|nr:MarR family transcriptional regulator [Enterococcus raffinosus]MBS6432598.1 MarR family transcriptional regulator [Enterococcus raffinosus]MDK7992592.1 MarR family transcriptional regulator [Enterococcus raffinosus]MDT2540262.1 MarR family transcriptional regulator [Enterococcus raffinosus]MDT2573830.1 MarR family transcriptional regulator [Enterococcus raffinosus]QXJ61113.1 MarR family transcriptional regulator [Enterococcus raffinosus]
MDEKELNVTVTQKYFDLNDLFTQFFRENARGPFKFENRNRGQSQILAIIREHGTISQKALVSQLDMRPQSASEMIRKLEKKDYITREKSQEDRRVMNIHLTARGKIAAQQSDDFQPVILDVLSHEEKEQFDHILTKLINELEPQVKHKPRDQRGRP